MFELTASHYQGTTVPRSRWEPPDVVGNKISEPYVQEGEEVLRRRLEQEVDAELDTIETLKDEAKAQIEAMEKFPNDIGTTETNIRYGGTDAVRHVETLADKIESDRSAGDRHHDRAPTALAFIAKWAPWAEALGFFVFAAFFLDVPVLTPWVDWMGWTFAVVLVVGICLILAWSVHYAAVAHNHMREAAAEGQKHAAERSRRNRLIFGAIVVVAAGGITFGMVERGLRSLAGAGPVVTFVMIGLAVITGLLLPVLTFWGKAFDGSKVSREHDAMVADLDEDFLEYGELREQVELNETAIAEIDQAILTRRLPDIREEVQATVNGARVPYGFLRLQIGLPAQPAPPGESSIEVGDNGPVGHISNGIPGADAVSMRPIFDRLAHLQALRDELQTLHARFVALPPHPWDHSSTR
jgi:hypothetical protein